MKTTIPTIIELALEYGTINDSQFQHITSLSRGKNKNSAQQEIKFLLAQEWASQYQIELLVLLRNYHIVRKAGEEFGQIVLEKGFASKKDIDKARNFQKGEFKSLRNRKLIGEILLEKGIITKVQRDTILKEQAFLTLQAKELRYIESNDGTLYLDSYESRFLQNKTFDQEFADKLIEKGIATQKQIQKAYQEQSQQRAGGYKISSLDQIMVDMEMISSAQRNMVLAQQRQLRVKASSGKTAKDHALLTVLEQKMLAMACVPTKLLEEDTSSEQKNLSQTILNNIKQTATEQKILNGIYSDALLFCHIQNRSKQFIFAFQDFSSGLFEIKQASFLFRNEAEQTKNIPKGTALTREDPALKKYPKTDIFGNKKEYLPELDFTFRIGPGTRQSRDGTTILANRSGRPYLSLDRKVCVSPSLNILEDMDKKYGQQPDAYADIFVSGMIKTSYPLSAGIIKAREIRDTKIHSLGDIKVEDGITNSFIRTQGNIQATYINNCYIQAFGDICITNEMIDCQIECSGKILSPSCRIVSSSITAKQGVFVYKIGSERSGPCTICAGSEQHLVSYTKSIQEQIDSLKMTVQNMKDKIEALEKLSKKTFRKMQDVKIFHDKASKKKQAIESQYLKMKGTISISQQKNISLLISKFESRMLQAVDMIKELNPAKKKIDKNIKDLRQKIEAQEQAVAPEIMDLKRQILSIYEWGRKKENCCEIQCSGKALKGVILKGVYSESTLDDDKENFTVSEISTNPSNQISVSNECDTYIQYNIQLSSGTEFV